MLIDVRRKAMVEESHKQQQPKNKRSASVYDDLLQTRSIPDWSSNLNIPSAKPKTTPSTTSTALQRRVHEAQMAEAWFKANLINLMHNHNDTNNYHSFASSDYYRICEKNEEEL